MTPTEGYALENLSSLKNALTRQKQRGDEYKAKAESIPDGFDFDANARKLKQLSEQQGFNPDEERKALKIEVQKNLENEFKRQIDAKDAEIESYRGGIEKSAREGIYAEASKIGIDKMLLQSYLEAQTVVEIKDGGYTLTFVNKDGTPRNKASDNGDVLPYSAKNFISDLSEHEVYGKLVTTDANSGDGGEQTYQGQTPQAGQVSRESVGTNLEAIASGEKRVAD